MSLVKLSTLSLGLVLIFLPNTVIANKTPEHSVRITTNVRVRYEYVNNQLPASNAADDAVVTRISTHAAYQYGPLQFEAELMDSRKSYKCYKNRKTKKKQRQGRGKTDKNKILKH